MSNTVIGTLQGPSVPSTQPYPATWKQAVDYIVQNTEVTAAVAALQQFFSFGSSVPGAEYQSYPWFRTTDSRWYFYQGGLWISRHPVPPYSGGVGELRFFRGQEADVDTYDGGENAAVTTTAGPFWEIDTAMEGRFPIGVDAGTYDVGDTGGEATHVLTLAELPADLTVPVQTDPNAGDPYMGHDTNDEGDIGVNRSPANNDVIGSGAAHNNLPPYFAGFWIRRTGRLYHRAS